jgi:hypothetical protein
MTYELVGVVLQARAEGDVKWTVRMEWQSCLVQVWRSQDNRGLLYELESWLGLKSLKEGDDRISEAC